MGTVLQTKGVNTPLQNVKLWNVPILQAKFDEYVVTPSQRQLGEVEFAHQQSVDTPPPQVTVVFIYLVAPGGSETKKT